MLWTCAAVLPLRYPLLLRRVWRRVVHTRLPHRFRPSRHRGGIATLPPGRAPNVQLGGGGLDVGSPPRVLICSLPSPRTVGGPRVRRSLPTVVGPRGRGSIRNRPGYMRRSTLLLRGRLLPPVVHVRRGDPHVGVIHRRSRWPLAVVRHRLRGYVARGRRHPAPRLGRIEDHGLLLLLEVRRRRVCPRYGASQIRRRVALPPRCLAHHDLRRWVGRPRLRGGIGIFFGSALRPPSARWLPVHRGGLRRGPTGLHTRRHTRRHRRRRCRRLHWSTPRALPSTCFFLRAPVTVGPHTIGLRFIAAFALLRFLPSSLVTTLGRRHTYVLRLLRFGRHVGSPALGISAIFG
mmetsp:Transcript_33826/g.95176  ORF Transcript_33826/g.95176 Transcript_33826/m.95176 type:complete len:347 (+) Transcript_33826:4015-5055(+)